MWWEKNQLISIDVYIIALPKAEQYENEPYYTWNNMFWKTKVLRNSEFIDLKKNCLSMINLTAADTNHKFFQQKPNQRL